MPRLATPLAVIIAAGRMRLVSGETVFFGGGIRVKFVVTIDRDEDGAWVVECPAIPGCVSQGATRSEALDNVKDAIAACLAVRSELGMPLTVEIHQVEVVA